MYKWLKFGRNVHVVVSSVTKDTKEETEGTSEMAHPYAAHKVEQH